MERVPGYLCLRIIIVCAMTFAEKEGVCEVAFREYGPYWHLYTDGTAIGNIFCDEEDFKAGMTLLAVCAVLCPGVMLLTFELMGNHIHLIICGERADCLRFFDMYKRKLRRLFIKMGKVVNWEMFLPHILPIENLRSLRNEIIYANRNAYVASYKYTPFSYPWGGGWAYFSPVINQLPVMSVREVGFNKVRERTHYRDVEVLAELKFVGDVPFIPSFCRTDIGEMMFQDARSYFHLLTRNAEAFSQIASRLKDTVFLTDDEMFVVAARYAAEMFSAKLSGLTPGQRVEIARKLHFDYNASNQQIRRLLKLDISLLGEMFPEARL